MGRKVHPMGFRIGIIRDWQSKWYDDQHYADFILEDVKLRRAIRSKYGDAGISLVEIERQANKVSVTIHTSRPGIVIGRGGQRVEEMRQYLEGVISKKIQLEIREIRQAELDAYLVARSVAEQMERRVAYRRAMKQSIFRSMQAGAKGMRIVCSGRLGGVEIARRQMMHQGRVPLQTLRADIDYGFTEAHTTMGRIGVKVWIYRGDIFPEAEAPVEVSVIEATSATPGPLAEAVAALQSKPAVEEEAKLVETPPKEKAEEAPVAEAKKPRARKKPAKAQEPAAEVSPVAEKAAAKAEEPKETEKKARPRAKKAVKPEEAAPVKSEEPLKKKPAKTRAKPAAAKESKAKAKKEE